MKKSDLSEKEQEEIMNRLKKLGYIEWPGTQFIRTHEHWYLTISPLFKMAKCIECDHLYIRKDDATTYFCLKHRDYLTNIEEEIECLDFKVQEKYNS